MKILYVTDLHGDKEKYRKTLDLAIEKEISVIVNGGDMLPKLGERHLEQPEFINGFLRDYFRELQDNNITYLTMLGNDDLLAVDTLFEDVCGEFENVHNIASKKIYIEGYEIIGMNYILDHPFGCKDRVITETRYIPQRQLSPFAGISNEHGYDRIFNWFEYSRTELPQMCDVLDGLPAPENPQKAYFSLDYDTSVEHDALVIILTPAEILEQKEENARLYQALASLPEKQRNRITSHFLLGMSLSEIAKSEESAVSSVHEGIQRGIRRLKKILENLETDPENNAQK